MTTVAWDGKRLAGDRKLTSNGAIVTEMTKVKKREDGALVGVAGEACTVAEFVRWFMAGEEGEKPSLKAKNSVDNCGAAIVVRSDGTVEAHDQDGWHLIESEHYAIGSGDKLALVAMRLGKHADCAVEIAAEFDVYTGSRVDVVHHGNTANGRVS